MDYGDEPRQLFTPLSEEDYCRFYQLEMDDYADDLPFYAALLRPGDAILELGCGTGRLSRRLARLGHPVTGLDHSARMLRLAAAASADPIDYRLGDMRDFSLERRFNAILIPHNTLNLLADPAAVRSCLECCRSHLDEGGFVAAQLHVADPQQRRRAGEKIFQFRIYPLTGGGKLIKETLKCLEPEKALLTLEERYRVRPPGDRSAYRDLSHVMRLYSPPPSRWSAIFRNCGFSRLVTWGGLDRSPFTLDSSSTLLLRAACD